MNEQEFVQRYLAEERDFSGIDFTDIKILILFLYKC